MDVLPRAGHRTSLRHRPGDGPPRGPASVGGVSLNYLHLAGGFIYLLMGADLLVRGAVALARRTRVSPMVVAFTVVAFGTSLPELVVTLRASLAGFPGLVLGNVVGSNTANVLLVGGVSAVFYPLAASGGSVRRDAVVLTVVGFVFALMCLSGDLGRVDGLILLVGFAAVLTMMARETVTAHREADTATPLEWVLGLPSKLGMIVLFLVLGLVGLPVGATLLVEAAVDIAVSLGVSDTVVGLTLVAIGTSLPELATTFMAALQKRTDVAIGTIVGSNTFNIVAIMGLGAVVSPRSVDISRRFLILDLPVMLVAGLALAYFALRERNIGRGPGIAFVVAYLGYLGVLLATA